MTAPTRPVLAFVGRPGQGTSSAVATLVEAETGIGTAPFTTIVPRRWQVPAEGPPLADVIDLPGLEDAARALHWLGARPATTEACRARVLEFVAAQGGAEFGAERAALEAVAAGACPIHVVDGSRPFRPNHVADADLLAWAGPPGVLLVVRAGGTEDHCANWLGALADRYPNCLSLELAAPGPTTREALLAAVALARPAWRSAMMEVHHAMVRRRTVLRSQAAAAVARLLVDQLTYAEELTVDRADPLEERRAELEARFHRRLSEREEEARAQVERLYGFASGMFEAGTLGGPVWRRDLFAEDTWTTLGLSPRLQVGAAAAAGAASGGAADLAVGGTSFGAGAAIGAAVGAGAAAWNLSRRRLRAHEAGPLASMRRAFDALVTTSRTTRLVIGPHDGASFPWVLLERAALHHAAVAARSHARRGADVVAAAAPEPARRDDAAFRKLERIFARIRSNPVDPGTSVAELAPEVEQVLAPQVPRAE